MVFERDNISPERNPRSAAGVGVTITFLPYRLCRCICSVPTRKSGNASRAGPDFGIDSVHGSNGLHGSGH